MEKVIKEDVSVGSGIIGVFPRMPQKLERVFAEFIDNSTQSFNDHKEELQRKDNTTVCKVSIVWGNNEITITDNAYGMSHDEFKHALKLNDPRNDYSENSRSQYGMGLKTAASYMGEWYEIETTMLGGKECFRSVVDVEERKKSNPTEIDNFVTDVPENKHYTKITIKKLLKKLSNSIDASLRKKLAAIYAEDLNNGDLEIVLNGRPIISVDPDLRINGNTGSEYISYFEDEFEFNEEIYKYSGWVGILNKGTTDDAGFTLSQYGRGIKLNYRPGDIFGKTNSFAYQRIVGEIMFDEKWKVSFNKDEFIWDDGLEKEFIKSLKNNAQVKEMVSTSNKLRADSNEIKPVVKQEDAKKSAEKIQNKYVPLKNVTRTNIAPVENNQPTVVIKNDEQIKENIVKIEWESIEYSFDIQIKNDDPDLDWLTVQKKGENNSYYIVLNGTTRFFADYNNKNCKDLIIDFAVSLALMQLSSVRVGIDLEKSTAMLRQLNEILKNVN